MGGIGSGNGGGNYGGGRPRARRVDVAVALHADDKEAFLLLPIKLQMAAYQRMRRARLKMGMMTRKELTESIISIRDGDALELELKADDWDAKAEEYDERVANGEKFAWEAKNARREAAEARASAAKLRSYTS